MKQKYKDFIIEIKRLINNLGRTNFITPSQIDELFIKYNINMKELKNEKTEE